MYLVFLLADAWLAAAPASLAVFATCASTYVSGTVTSHASGLPLDYGYYYYYYYYYYMISEHAVGQKWRKTSIFKFLALTNSFREIM